MAEKGQAVGLFGHRPPSVGFLVDCCFWYPLADPLEDLPTDPGTTHPRQQKERTNEVDAGIGCEWLDGGQVGGVW